MSIDSEKIAPYAPANCVMTVVERLRKRGLPEQLNVQELARMGIAEGNISRTLQALRLLNIIDEEGYPMPVTELLGNAPDNEYPEVFGQILKEAYGSVFQYVDPATANDQDLLNAFRPYQPKAQHDRMIRLFKALCRAANLMPGGTPDQSKRTRPKPSNTQRDNSSRKKQMPPETGEGSKTPPRDNTNDDTIDSEYPLVEALVQQLPKGERKHWKKNQRDRWLAAIAANLDVLIEVEDESAMST